MRPSGDAIIIDNKKRILLLKRSDYTLACPGDWGIPGGKGNNNETPEEAVIRETKEESGLDFIPKKLYQTSLIPNSGEVIHTHKYLGERSGEISIQEEEADGYAWFSYNETRHLNIAFDYQEIFDQLHADGLI